MSLRGWGWSNLWSVWGTDRWGWFTRKKFELNRKSHLTSQKWTGFLASRTAVDDSQQNGRLPFAGLAVAIATLHNADSALLVKELSGDLEI